MRLLERFYWKLDDSVQEKYRKTIRFLARLVVLALPLYLIMWLGVDMYPLQVTVASQSGWVLKSAGYSVEQNGAGLDVNGFRFYIVQDCTGWKSMLFLFALIFAVPGVALRRRLLGMVFGLPILWLGNLSRICAVVVTENGWGIDTAMFVHNILFQAGLIAFVLGLWIAWLRFPETWIYRRIRNYIKPVMR